MATPLVAGSVAVIRQFLRAEHKMSAPSAALLKALVINGAHLLAGQYVPSEAGAAPNNSQGFGRVDVRAVVGPYAPNASIKFFEESKALDTGESQTFSMVVPSTARQLKVTLVWTDPPGEGLQSDLDLTVKIGTAELHGNMPIGSMDFDRTNNVEQVVWTNVTQGTAEIRVSAFSISVAEQTFALVISLC